MTRTVDLVQMLKDHLRDGAIHRWIQRWKDRAALADWKAEGSPLPPPQVFKQQLIRDVAEHFGTRVLVETGTSWGNTVAASLGTFDRIHSIELHDEFYHRAVRRFARHCKVRIYYGDSAQLLPRIMDELQEPALFWLDAHYSGEGTAKADVDTPIAQELLTISKHFARNHAILIDDARLFDSTNGYPSLDDCRKTAAEYWPQHKFGVANDVIAILPSVPR